jgi:hypothetical protein
MLSLLILFISIHLSLFSGWSHALPSDASKPNTTYSLGVKKPALGKHSFSKNRGGSCTDKEQINCYLHVGVLAHPYNCPPQRKHK